MNAMTTRILESLAEVSADHWNALSDGRFPFVRYEFLRALEKHNAVGELYGWYPQYVLIEEDGIPVAAAPMYIKDNSYGEFVFDWAWADAWHRAGLRYYPKLVVAIPYTPATGPRLLVRADRDFATYALQLVDAATAHAQQSGMSSLHWLFTDERDTRLFQADPRYLMRLGCQFHWQNDGYRDFDDYLSHFTQQKRKKIRRERRMVQEQGVEIEIRHGDEMEEQHWDIYHRFYRSTFERKSGIPTLSREFFMEIGETMPNNMVVVMAKHQGEYVAAAFNIRGDDTLYGRHWGCNREFHSLHFEACYYQGLDYCIDHGLQWFEPGAQGEHKISRGFLPTPTWSAHWIAHEGFREGLIRYLDHEREAVEDYIDELQDHSPFKQAG
ncbi:GNAT family N-acetyltransferase [Thiohalophilus sp.]|uniref:GNAT family N-acetyltransferase n=1 Tax=Thiohalophilus sp. TaxID=3028392 RepID=UPI002ACEDEAD|nr:GNAT family N-acetyltransferase [Thiohalophilus sp.]MDZ7662929.1 GNAT family N-acetyltransferase [Thiohalophilus sp.]